MSDDANKPVAEQPAKKARLYAVRLKSAYWPEEDLRREPGETLHLPLAEAKALIAEGKAERGDELGA